MKLCLLNRSYRHALPVLNRAMYHFPAGPSHAYQAHRQFFLCSEHGSSAAYITHASGFTAQVTYKDHLQYFLYGAMIYMALKEWESALHLLRIVISCPVANTVSKIMVEAYKKWLLVSLLVKGKVCLKRANNLHAIESITYRFPPINRLYQRLRWSIRM
jgi:COP9 signalosome complex subunit 3